MGGLATYGKQQALLVVLEATTTYYIGFLTAQPSDDDGTGLVEATGSGYARKSHAAWETVDESPEWYRVNTGVVTFAALTADLDDVVGWGIWTAVTAGTLIAWGPILDVTEVEITQDFTNGNQPSFPTLELKVGID